MNVFLDTGVLSPAHDDRSNRHETARSTLRRVLAGEHGRTDTSDYAYDEAVTLTRSRTGSFEAALRVGDRVLGRGDHPDVYELFRVDRPVLESAVDVFDGAVDRLPPGET